MTRKLDRSLLHRKWVHVHEEDTATEMVFRPADTRLPPSRGRTGFELRADHSAAHLAVGRTDVPDVAEGFWDLKEGDLPQLQIQLETGETQLLTVVSVESDRLRVRKNG